MIPKPAPETTHMRAGQRVQVEAPAGLVIRSATHRYKLDELLAQCDAGAPMHNDVADWQKAFAVAREVW